MNVTISPELEEAREQNHPVDASLGGDNAFYLGHCGVVDHRPPYAMCMKHVADRKEGRLDSRWAACSAAVGNKTCAAIKLRKEELAAGKALYYVPRSRMRELAAEREEESNSRFARLLEGGKRTVERAVKAVKAAIKPETPKKDARPDDLFAPAKDGFAEAITRAAAKEAEKPAPTPKVKAEPSPSKPAAPAVKLPTGGLMALAKKRAA